MSQPTNNKCTVCGIDMGEHNPRQLCCKTYCPLQSKSSYDDLWRHSVFNNIMTVLNHTNNMLCIQYLSTCIPWIQHYIDPIDDNNIIIELEDYPIIKQSNGKVILYRYPNMSYPSAHLRWNTIVSELVSFLIPWNRTGDVFSCVLTK